MAKAQTKKTVPGKSKANIADIATSVNKNISDEITISRTVKAGQLELAKMEIAKLERGLGRVERRRRYMLYFSIATIVSVISMILGTAGGGNTDHLTVILFCMPFMIGAPLFGLLLQDLAMERKKTVFSSMISIWIAKKEFPKQYLGWDHAHAYFSDLIKYGNLGAKPKKPLAASHNRFSRIAKDIFFHKIEHVISFAVFILVPSVGVLVSGLILTVGSIDPVVNTAGVESHNTAIVVLLGVALMAVWMGVVVWYGAIIQSLLCGRYSNPSLHSIFELIVEEAPTNRFDNDAREWVANAAYSKEQ